MGSKFSTRDPWQESQDRCWKSVLPHLLVTLLKRGREGLQGEPLPGASRPHPAPASLLAATEWEGGYPSEG